MTEGDLSSVADWLLQLHVARWWTSATTPEEVVALYLPRIKGQDRRTHMLMVSENGEEVGWCQWYLWANYPGESQARAVHEGEIGIDYAIGDPAHVGRGLGTRLVAALVEQARSAHPGAGVLVDPEESNVASRRVLEKNGFVLIDVRVIASEEGNPRRALYRHSATPRTS